MPEYDFRIENISLETDPGKIRELRDCLLDHAGGFTEIQNGVLVELIPGKGTGYVVDLDDAGLVDLVSALELLCARWGCEPPPLSFASQGPRSEYAFLLIPELANEDEFGYRRKLFSLESKERITNLLNPDLAFDAVRVYGEWRPNPEGQTWKDVSVTYVFQLGGIIGLQYLTDFIQEHVFDGGVECDQLTFYVSVGGVSHYVVDKEEI